VRLVSTVLYENHKEEKKIIGGSILKIPNPMFQRKLNQSSSPELMVNHKFKNVFYSNIKLFYLKNNNIWGEGSKYLIHYLSDCLIFSGIASMYSW